MGRCMVLGGVLNDVLYYLGLGGLVRLDLKIQLPRQEEMGENTPFTQKSTSEPLETLERVTT